MSSNTKKCISCKEEIKFDALKCPHCHQVQSSIAALHTSPAFTWVIAILFSLVAAWVFYSISKDISDRKKVPTLEISDNKLLIGQSNDGKPNVSCFARVKNSQARYINEPSLQAQFYDSTERQVDVHYVKLPFNLMPTAEAEARVTGSPTANPSAYSTCKISLLAVQ